MIYEHTSYRAYLKDLLAQKTAHNPRYSLRAMAKQLGIAPSSLSEVLGARCGISLTSARKIALRLGLSPEETEYFCLLVQLEASEDPLVRESISLRMRSINPKAGHSHDLSVDQFRQIADWHHSAILELVSLEGDRFNATLAAKRLGISKIDAEVAVDRLVRLELLEADDRGKLNRVHNRLVARSNAMQDQAIRKFFDQTLQKAAAALGNQSPQERVSGYETLPLAAEAIPEAREIVERFFSEMIDLSRRTPRRRDVYHLTLHLFNLTPKNPKNSSLKGTIP